jgi:hypothetical protein
MLVDGLVFATRQMMEVIRQDQALEELKPALPDFM